MGTIDRPGSVYLDTNCFVDWAQGTGSPREAESMLRAGRAGRMKLYTSALTLAGARGTSDSAHRLRIRALLQEPYITLSALVTVGNRQMHPRYPAIAEQLGLATGRTTTQRRTAWSYEVLRWNSPPTEERLYATRGLTEPDPPALASVLPPSASRRGTVAGSGPNTWIRANGAAASAAAPPG